MTLVGMLVGALIGLAVTPDPVALVGDLDSPEEAVRTEAAGALEELGPPALAALYRVRDSDKPELRRQATQLIDLIERQRLLRATKVRLDFEDKPLVEVAKALGTQVGFPVNIEPDETLRSRRVTLHASDPVPFWEALDRLGAAGGVRHNPGVPFSFSPRMPTILLGRAQGPPVPVSDAGPFRVYLVRLARHRELKAVRPPALAKLLETFTVDFQFAAEPQLVVNPIGPMILDEVVDDGGRDLRPEPPTGPHPRRWSAPRFEDGHAALFAMQMPLKLASGGRLRRLKGHVPITVITRTGDPIVVPLDAEEGKTFTKGGVTLSLFGLRHTADSTTFTLTIRGEPAGGSFSPQQVIPLGEYHPPYRLDNHLQVQDDQGRALHWSTQAVNQIIKPGDHVSQITISRRPKVGPVGAPDRVLYYGIVGAATEVAFEFTDLPWP